MRKKTLLANYSSSFIICNDISTDKIKLLLLDIEIIVIILGNSIFSDVSIETEVYLLLLFSFI